MKFQGGYTFKGFSGAAAATLDEVVIPDKLEIPVHASDKHEVTAGSAVKAGEKLLTGANGIVVSPANGTVAEMTAEMITIKTDGTAAFSPVEGHPREPWRMSHNEAVALYVSTGCSLMSDGRFITDEACAAVNHVIVNAAFNGPLNRTFEPDAICETGLFANGLKTVAALFPKAKLTVAVNKRNREYAEETNAEILIVPDKYPQEHPEALSRVVADKPLISPVGKVAPDIAVLGFTEVMQIAETMTRGRPLIDRIVIIAGDGVSRPGWYRIRIGTPIVEVVRELVKSEGIWRTIRGDVFTGMALKEAEGSVMFEDTAFSVIEEHAVRELFNFVMPKFAGDSYSRVTAAEYIPLVPKRLDTNMHGGVRPCVQCNYCDEVCPVGIYPFLIWKYVAADMVEESFRLRPYDCISCGLCNYVCPSKIDIMSSVEQASAAYSEMKRSGDETD